MSDLRKSIAASRPSVFLPDPAGRPSVFLSANAGTRPSVFLGNGNAGPTPSANGSNPGGSFGFGSSASSDRRWTSKQAELQGLLALENQVNKLVGEIKTMDERVGGIVEGSQTFASVTASWQGVFRAIQISRADLAMLSTETAGILMNTAAASGNETQAAAPEQDATESGTRTDVQDQEDPLATLDEDQVRVHTLVRIPVDDEGVNVATSPDAGDAAATTIPL